MDAVAGGAWRLPLIGREGERELVVASLEAAAAGLGGAVLVVTGEPGIGKTRLAEEAAAVGAERGVRGVWGRCWDDGAPLYWPWTQVLRALGAFADERWAGRLARLSGPGVPAGDGDAKAARFELFDAVTSFLREATGTAPLVVLLEDLHWADAPSLRLLQFVARHTRELPLVVLATLRDSEFRLEAEVAEALADVRAEAIQIAVRGLDVDEVERLVKAATGSMAADAGQLRDATGGNPLFVLELARFGDASGAPPPTVAGVLDQRLRGLRPGHLRAVEVAAVLGADGDDATLAAVYGGDAGDALDAASALGLVERGDGRWRFVHALVRDAVAATIAPVDLVAWHCAAASVGARDPGARAAVAAHLLAAAELTTDPSDARRAADAAVAAGSEMFDRLAWEEVDRLAARTLAVLDAAVVGDDRLRAVAHLAIARARALRDGPDVARGDFELAWPYARRSGDAALVVDAVLGTIGATESGRPDADGVARIEQALEALGEHEHVWRARLLARLQMLHLRAMDLASAEAAAEAAADEAEASGDPKVLLEVRIVALELLECAGRVRDWDAALAEIDELSAKVAAPGSRPLVERVTAAVRQGDGDRFRAEALSLQRATGIDATARWQRDVVVALGALIEGRYDDAEAVLEAAVASGEGVWGALMLQYYGAGLFTIRRDQGRSAELVGGAELFVAEYPLVDAWRSVLALAYAESGRVADAAFELGRLVERGLRSIPHADSTWIVAIALAGEVAAQLGDGAVAKEVVDLLVPFAGEHLAPSSPPVSYLGAADHYLGRAAAASGDVDAAIGWLEAAVVAHRRMRARPLVARSAGALAGVLLQRGGAHDVERARELAAEARSIRDELRLTGIPVPEVAAAPARAVDVRRHAALARDGDDWTVSFSGTSVRVRHGRGVEYLARLLAEPGRELHALDLAASLGSRSAARGPEQAPLEVLDDRARREYQRRIADLRAEIDDAEAANDAGSAERARSELDKLTRALAAAFGLGGRSRAPGSNAERARQSVSKAIKQAVDKLASLDCALGDHLRVTVRTGTFCSYVPDPQAPVAWKITA